MKPLTTSDEFILKILIATTTKIWTYYNFNQAHASTSLPFIISVSYIKVYQKKFLHFKLSITFSF